MSNPLAKSERSKAKDLRQGVKPQRERNPKARKGKKRFGLRRTYEPAFGPKEWVFTDWYETPEARENAMKAKSGILQSVKLRKTELIER